MTTFNAPLTAPTISLPVEFRQNATDADNDGVTTIASAYAQDQIALSAHVEAVVGLRYDSFNADVTNNRTATDFTSNDGLVSPRVGLIYKPIVPLSLYGSYSLTYLPRAGEQLSSLSLTNQALDPEEFRNYEVGAKWDVFPSFSFTAALYRLDRGNVMVPDPNDPARSILVDAQRTKGLELGVNGNITARGAWRAATPIRTARSRGRSPRRRRRARRWPSCRSTRSRCGTSTTSRLAWPRHSASSTAATCSPRRTTSSCCPSWTRVDAAVYYNLTSTIRAQVNIENLFDEDYYPNAHSNTNITPGSPRAVRLALTTRF